MKKRFRPALFLFLMLLLHLHAFSEGTKEILLDSLHICRLNVSTGTPGPNGYSCFGMETCPSGQRMNVRIVNPGEVIYFGFSIQGGSYTIKVKYNGLPYSTLSIPASQGSPGTIQYYSQAVAGPSVLDPHGYPAYKFVPGNPGDYSFNFVSPYTLDYFDLTVVDTTQTPRVPIKGRLWSKDWGFENDNLTESGAMYATQYIYTDDSVVSTLSYNGMQGDRFDVTCTRNGCFPPPVPWETSCKSVIDNHHYFQYKIFMNDPDTVAYPSGTLGAIEPNSIHVDRMCDGSFKMNFTVNKAGWVKVILDVDPTPGPQPIDVVITDSALFGPNTFIWDGKNGFGEPVPCGDSVGIGFTFVNGLTNIALFDVERNIKGFIIQGVRPGNAVVKTYWNDELVGGNIQLDGCLPALPDSGCHKWTGDYNVGLGDGNTINTWWYAGSSEQVAGFFRVNCIPVTPVAITGPTDHCASGFGDYATEPLPLPGGDTCQWVLTDNVTGTVLLDTIAGPSVSISYSGLSQGPKSLKVRGVNTMCGDGEYSPPYLINIIPSTQVSNPVNEYSICTGDSVHIIFQATLPLTSFTYTATATSSFLSGYSGGANGRIDQKLINSGTTNDSVIYRVVPFLDPCYGDTFDFIIRVHPLDEKIIISTPVTTTLCEGDMATVYVDSSLVAAVYQWQLNGVNAGGNNPSFSFVPVNGDKVRCFVTSPEVCNPTKTVTSDSIQFSVAAKKTVTATVTPVANPVCVNNPVTVTATGANWGSSPQFIWSFQGTVLPDTNASISYHPSGNGYLQCKVISSESCTNGTTVLDSIQIILADSVRTVDTLLCFGERYFAGGQWRTEAGSYTDTVSQPTDCIRFVITELTYKAQIQADLGNGNFFCTETYPLDPGTPGSATYLWQDGTTNSTCTVDHPGIYWVEVTQDGCSVTDSVRIKDCPLSVYFPTAFTPNGDGENDQFRPRGISCAEFRMDIYDRWGMMIFTTNSFEMGWDGKTGNQECPAGIYPFVANMTGFSGEKQTVKGVITLLR